MWQLAFASHLRFARTIQPAFHQRVGLWVVAASGAYSLEAIDALHLKAPTGGFFPDLRALGRFPQLVHLTIEGYADAADLRALEAASQLMRLRIDDCPVGDLAPLAALTRLQRLEIVWCQRVADLRPLARLERLHSLTVAYARALQDLGPLGELTNLTRLDLRGCDALQDLARSADARRCRISTWQSAALCRTWTACATASP